MALIRVAQYSSTPTVVADYQAQNAHLQAFTNQLMTQQFILDSGTAQPVIKQGCYVSHGGSLYVADADTPITGSPSDGSVYIRVSGTTSLTVEFVTDISGYAWNPVYTALTSGSYTLLPYLIVKSGSTWTRYNFNPNNQAFGNAIIDGHDIDSELDTLNSRVNQAVNTTSSPTFASINTGQGATEVHLMNQNLRTTDSVEFSKLSISSSSQGSIDVPHAEGINDRTIVPKGIYLVEFDNSVDLQAKVGSLGAWTRVKVGVDGIVISDGVNVAFRQTTGSTIPLNYRKFS